MTRRILIAMALLVSATGHSQVGYNDNPDNGHGHQNRNKYYEKVQKLDSVIGFLKDNGSGSDVKDYVFIYNYSRGKDVPGEVVKLGLPERTKINRQLYSYTSDGFKTRYLYQEWIGDVWQDRMLVEYFPDDYG
ncbi:hypothetical protein EG832_22900, partial [bacterium]|nr:hypothetical protein [bacterium]